MKNLGMSAGKRAGCILIPPSLHCLVYESFAALLPILSMAIRVICNVVEVQKRRGGFDPQTNEDPIALVNPISSP
jgi:hypothetical protein